MHLQVGSRRFDVTHRALVAGVLDLGSGGVDATLTAADALVGEGADVVVVRSILDPAPAPAAGLLAAVSALTGRIVVPIGVEAPASAATAALEAGASLAQCVGDPSEQLAERASDLGAAVVVAGCIHLDEPPSPIARLLASGLAAESIVLEALALDAVPPLARLGYPVQHSVLHVPTTAPEREAGLAKTAAAITAGCRLIRTHDVAGARRTAAVLAAISEAR